MSAQHKKLTVTERTLRLKAKLDEQWLSLHRKRPQYLFHYTNAQGLLGMLQSNRIWATNCRFMNDPTEIAYGIHLVREISQSVWPKKDTKGWSELKDILSLRLKRFEKSKVYIACFCAAGDLLSQWRGYGAVGGGYSIGFSAREIGVERLNFREPVPPKAILRKVIYDRRTQERLITDWLRGVSVLEQARLKNPSGPAVQSFMYLWGNFNTYLCEFLICFKDTAYREEQEWRVIQFGTVKEVDVLKASFRTGGAHAIPYVELDFTLVKGPYRGKLPAQLIRYGPTLDPLVTERSLRLLCEACGYTERHLTIKRSGVPFTG